MNKPAPMTKESEARIMRVLERVSSGVGGGDHPDDAIVKSARAEGLPVGHLGLVVNAYNTGMTTRVRQDGAGPLEKSADFPLASHADVLEKLFPAEVKTAAARALTETVSMEYMSPPAWYRATQVSAVFEKAASSITWAMPGGKPAPLDPDPSLAVKRAYNACAEDDKRVEEARRLVSVEADSLVAKLAAVREYFSSRGALSVADVRANVETVLGKEGSAVLREVEGLRPSLSKAASWNPNHRVDVNAPPYSLIKSAVDAGKHAIAFAAAHESLAAKAAADRASRLAPFRPGPQGPPSLLDGLLEKSALGPRSLGDGIGYALAGDLVHGLGSSIRKSHEDVENQVARSLSSPDHDAALRGIHTNAMLQNLMANDEVVRGHDPMKVTDAFNRISTFAPRVSQHPILMEALLRRSLQGQTDPFEVGEIAKAESSEKSLRPKAPMPEAKHEKELTLPGAKAPSAVPATATPAKPPAPSPAPKKGP